MAGASQQVALLMNR